MTEPKTAWDYLNQDWPVNCSWCGVEIMKLPLIVKALGHAPSICGGCLKKWKESWDKPPTDQTIVFNGWKKKEANSDRQVPPRSSDPV